MNRPNPSPEQTTATDIEIPALPSGTVDVNGKPYLQDAKGNLVPLEQVKSQHLAEDTLVRKIHGYAVDLSEQIARFKVHTFDDISGFEALLAAEYDTTVGGRKGNKTFVSYDGLKKVQVQVADLIEFGPQLQAAKTLVDECLNEWAADARPELRSIVSRAFNVDKEGQINRTELFMLLRLDIEDERWRRAMDAIRDAIRVIGTKTYVRFYERGSVDEHWTAISVDLARA